MSTSGRFLEDLGDNMDESLGLHRGKGRPETALRTDPRDRFRRPSGNAGRLPVSEVIPDPAQPRTEFAREALERLSLSIRDHGQINPIQVRWSAEAGKWMIVSGERRWRACQHAGLTVIDCVFLEEAISDEKKLELQLIENCLREDLNPIEEARAFGALMDHEGWTGKQLADAIHVCPSRISRALALLRLPAEVQVQVETGTVAPRAAYELTRVSNGRLRESLINEAAAGKLTHAKAAVAARKSRAPAPRSTRVTFVTEARWSVVVSSQRKGNYHDVEQALTDALAEVRHWIEHGRQLY
jgi:ParB family chromosome partitioning protein